MTSPGALEGLEVRTSSPEAGAVFSPCLRYRYLLWRDLPPSFGADGCVLWLMLNPSTADEAVLDPTLRRVRDFSIRYGFARFEVVNLYALRSTDPAALERDEDPVGPFNDEMIAGRMRAAKAIVLGWGAHPMAAKRARQLAMVGNGGAFCLGTTSAGWPRHPLYLRKDAKLSAWTWPKGEP